MPDLRVVMLTPHGDPLGRIGEPEVGGQCVYVRELASHLSELGTEVTVFTRDRGEGRPANEIIAPAARLIRLPVGPSRFVAKEELEPWLPEFAAKVSSTLSGGEVIHSHFWDGAYVAARLERSGPWVHTSHSLGLRKLAALPSHDRAGYEGRLTTERQAARDSNCVVALTQVEAHDLIHLYGTPSERIRVIPPGVDTSRFRPGDDEKGHGPVDAARLPVVATLGRLDERKGFDLLFRAAAALLGRGVEARFVISTGTGANVAERAEHERLTRIVEDLKLGDHLTWLDVLEPEATPAFYRQADVFVMPSRYELFGIVMLEAMACGVPVVATRFGGPAEVIRDGVDGLLVDPQDTEGLADAILRLLERPQDRVEMGLRARAAIEGRYSWAAAAWRHAGLYADPQGGGGD